MPDQEKTERVEETTSVKSSTEKVVPSDTERTVTTENKTTTEVKDK